MYNLFLARYKIQFGYSHEGSLDVQVSLYNMTQFNDAREGKWLICSILTSSLSNIIINVIEVINKVRVIFYKCGL